MEQECGGKNENKRKRKVSAQFKKGRLEKQTVCVRCGMLHPIYDVAKDAALVAASSTLRAAREDVGSKYQTKRKRREERLATESQKLRAKVDYNGSRVHGFQRSAIFNYWVSKSVQLVLEEAVAKTFKLLEGDQHLYGLTTDFSDPLRGFGPNYGLDVPILVRGASRTDNGVNACGQVIDFDIPKALLDEKTIDMNKIQDTINSYMAEDRVVMRDLEFTDSTFDPSRRNRGKRYCYIFYDGVDHDPSEAALADRRFTDIWGSKRRQYKPQECGPRLDVDKMNQAIQLICNGTDRDFRLFTRSDSRTNRGTGSTIRNLSRGKVLRLSEQNPSVSMDDVESTKTGDYVHILAEGSGFLYLMMRCLATAILNVGKGELTIEDLMAKAFQPPASDQEIHKGSLVFPAAHPEGLTLVNVFY